MCRTPCSAGINLEGCSETDGIPWKHRVYPIESVEVYQRHKIRDRAFSLVPIHLNCLQNVCIIGSPIISGKMCSRGLACLRMYYSAFHIYAENVKFSRAVGPCLYRAPKSCQQPSLLLHCPWPPQNSQLMPSVCSDDMSEGAEHTLA
jgi:hypothetical protein